jgi:hypothetical protein
MMAQQYEHLNAALLLLSFCLKVNQDLVLCGGAGICMDKLY